MRRRPWLPDDGRCCAVPHALLADVVLLLHLGVVLFVVGGLLCVVAGGELGWGWVRGWPFRVLHLLAIVVIAVQAWLGQYCPLTLLESWLRVQAGQAAYEASFIGHWVQRLLYFDAPLWVFAIAYTGFALLVLWAWRRWPPLMRAQAPATSPP